MSSYFLTKFLVFSVLARVSYASIHKSSTTINLLLFEAAFGCRYRMARAGVINAAAAGAGGA